jgi:hypothetical protein
MLLGLYIIIDDEFDRPIYADPDPEEQDLDLWEYAAELVGEALEAERRTLAVHPHGESHVGLLVNHRLQLSFIAIVTDDVPAKSVQLYLEMLHKRYMDEVDDPRRPDRTGVDDVVVDVIPPWDE